jgi:hypothetical protein
MVFLQEGRSREEEPLRSEEYFCQQPANECCVVLCCEGKRSSLSFHFPILKDSKTIRTTDVCMRCCCFAEGLGLGLGLRLRREGEGREWGGGVGGGGGGGVASAFIFFSACS